MTTLRLTGLVVASLVILGCVPILGDPAAAQKRPTPVVSKAPTFNPLNYPTLGVYVENLSGERLQAGTLRSIEDEFMRAILGNGYALAARSDIDRVLRELKLQSSGITEQNIARVGRVLNVPAVMLVSVNSIATRRAEPPAIYNPQLHYYRTTVLMSARLVMAERAEVLWISSFTYDWDSASPSSNQRERWPDLLQYVASVVASGLPPRR